MIDFTKWLVPVECYSLLTTHPKLEWKHEYHSVTGELLKSEASYKFFKFLYQKPKFSKNPTEREFRLEFSFAQVLFNGVNYQDPTLNQIEDVIQFIESEFKIEAREAKLLLIEIGCTISPPVSYNQIDHSLIAYDGIPFDRIRHPGKTSIGRECYVTQLGIKLYGKHLKYPELNLSELFHCEVKIFKMGYLKTPEPITMANLTSNAVLNHLKSKLIDHLKKVIYKEDLDHAKFTIPQTKLLKNWSNPKYIEGLKKSRPQSYRKERTKYRELMPKNGIWNRIINRVIEKWNQLEAPGPLKKVSDFTINENGLNSCEVSDITYIVGNNQDNNVKRCKVTGIDISDQKEDSHFVAESTLMKIYQNDRELYKSLKNEYGPKRKAIMHVKDEMEAIAKNIRNRDSNPRKRERDIFNRFKNSLFPYEPMMPLFARC